MHDKQTGGDSEPIPYNRPFEVGTEYQHIREALAAGHLSADGAFSHACSTWLERTTGASAAFMVHSCTAALEMAVTLVGIEAGDEVIMPSFTFPSTATAVVARGGVPVFVDVRSDTLNIDPAQVEAAVTARTKAIMPVHYAGVGADMRALCEIAERHDLRVIEDAAQGMCATWDDRPLGTIGDLGALSFHETKNVMCGEGGALLVNDPGLIERAEILRDKGTNRGQFFRGEVAAYSWVDLGSSYAMSDLSAAFLWSQLTHAQAITARRMASWNRYHEAFACAEGSGLLVRPTVPVACGHNAHIYYLLLPDAACRDEVLETLDSVGINAVFHYLPLHSSPAGRRFGRAHGELKTTTDISSRLLRLPMWAGLEPEQIDRVIDATLHAVAKTRRRAA